MKFLLIFFLSPTNRKGKDFCIHDKLENFLQRSVQQVPLRQPEQSAISATYNEMLLQKLIMHRQAEEPLSIIPVRRVILWRGLRRRRNKENFQEISQNIGC